MCALKSFSKRLLWLTKAFGERKYCGGYNSTALILITLVQTSNQFVNVCKLSSTDEEELEEQIEAVVV